VIAYLDSSVLLRMVVGQKDRLRQWREVRQGVASSLVEVECLRTLDRLRLYQGIGHEAIAVRRGAIFRLLEGMELVEPTRPVLARASQPFPTPLGTLDAIHLATALLWREGQDRELVMATHDAALGMAARASGFDVVGT